jgi:hypothetical protein
VDEPSLTCCRWGGFTDPVDNVWAFHPDWHSVLSTVRAARPTAAGPYVNYGQSLFRCRWIPPMFFVAEITELAPQVIAESRPAPNIDSRFSTLSD